MTPTLIVPTGSRYTVTVERDWKQTLLQTIPRMRQVLRHLRPTWQLPHLQALDEMFLRAAGLRALIWDVDGTLTCYHGDHVADDIAGALDRLLAMTGVQHAIVSNCGEQRFEQLSRIFPRIPVIKGYDSAAGPLFRVRSGAEEQWSADPSGELQPIRKPHRALIDFALRLLQIRERSAVAVVGDQYLTDVASANLAGVQSIKLPTLRPETFPSSVRVLQGIDYYLHRLARSSRQAIPQSWKPAARL